MSFGIIKCAVCGDFGFIRETSSLAGSPTHQVPCPSCRAPEYLQRTGRSPRHPVDALKATGIVMSEDTEAELRRICDAEITVEDAASLALAMAEASRRVRFRSTRRTFYILIGITIGVLATMIGALWWAR